MGIQCLVPPFCNLQHGRSPFYQYANAARHAVLGGYVRKRTTHQRRWANWGYVPRVSHLLTLFFATRDTFGLVTDDVDRHERALASTAFSLAPFLGPVCGPIVGGFIVEKYGFRWVFWVQFIFAA